MNKLLKIWVLAALFSLVSILAVDSFSFAEVKFGYVDFIRVFNNYKKTVKAEEKLGKKGEKKQIEREKLVSQIKKIKDQIEISSEKEKEKKKKDIAEKIKKLQEFDKKVSKELLKEKDDAAKEIIKEFDEVIKEIAKKDGYTFIFNQRFILYGDSGYDLTEKVLNTLNKQYKGR